MNVGADRTMPTIIRQSRWALRFRREWPEFFLGRIFGIEIFLDASWFLVAALVTYTLATVVIPPAIPEHSGLFDFVWSVCAMLLFFATLLLHELGHSLVSQRCGVPVPRITLLFIGGLAEIAHEPDNAKAELKIALGGPVVSVCLSLLFFLLATLFSRTSLAAAQLLCEWLCGTNLFLVAFNLFPGYPLDGGRVLRAALWAKSGRLGWATLITSRIGVAFSWALVLAGIYLVTRHHLLNGMILFAMSHFLRNAAQHGYQQALAREARSRIS